MVSVNVRLEGPNEAVVRKAAEQAGVTLNRVLSRDDCVHGYGTMIVDTSPPLIGASNEELAS